MKIEEYTYHSEKTETKTKDLSLDHLVYVEGLCWFHWLSPLSKMPRARPCLPAPDTGKGDCWLCHCLTSFDLVTPPFSAASCSLLLLPEGPEATDIYALWYLHFPVILLSLVCGYFIVISPEFSGSLISRGTHRERISAFINYAKKKRWRISGLYLQNTSLSCWELSGFSQKSISGVGRGYGGAYIMLI